LPTEKGLLVIDFLIPTGPFFNEAAT